jgi:hypothetical protein
MARFLLLALGFLIATPAYAGNGSGVGVLLGSPNGITARHWIDEKNSFEGAAGWALTDSRFQVNANYLLTHPDLLQIGEETFDFFYGIGLSLRTKSGKQDGELVFGPRLPAGLGYEFTDPNIELFTQVALNVGLIPSSDLYLDANIGVRFYFF